MEFIKTFDLFSRRAVAKIVVCLIGVAIIMFGPRHV